MRNYLLLSNLLFLIVTFSIGGYSYGQNVYHLSEQVNAQGEGSYSVERLSVGSVPTAVYGSSNTNSNAARLIINSESLAQINAADENYSSVEIIILDMPSLESFNNTSFPQNILDYFPSLKYVFFNCSFELCGSSGSLECEKQFISNFLNGSFEGISFLYRADLPN